MAEIHKPTPGNDDWDDAFDLAIAIDDARDERIEMKGTSNDGDEQESTTPKAGQAKRNRPNDH